MEVGKIVGPTVLGQGLPQGTHVQIINLESRSDRWEGLVKNRILENLRELEWARCPAVFGRDLAGYGQSPYFNQSKRQDRWANRGGCLLSHRKAIQACLDQGAEHGLILEDDIHFPAQLDTEEMRRLQKALESTNWDVLYLGYTSPVSPYHMIAEMGKKRRLYKVFGCNCGHAYLMNRRAMEWAMQYLPDENAIWPWLSVYRAIDRFYYRNMSSKLNVLALSPTLIDQLPGDSDILGDAVSRQELDDFEKSIADGKNSSAFGFQLKRHLKALQFQGSHQVDRIRGLGKRLKGF